MEHFPSLIFGPLSLPHPYYHSFIYLFNKYVLSTSSEPGTILSIENTVMHKAHKGQALTEQIP
jgi:hypothetical protein